MSSPHHLILASNSPRRQELLRASGFQFGIFTSDFPETFPERMDTYEVAEHLAFQKNNHYRSILGDQVIITADTTVIHRNKVLNKPANKMEAFEMLHSLSDDVHDVVCGVCISSVQEIVKFSDTTQVTFLALSDKEIAFYIDKYKPYDKAGAYGIQEWIGMTKVHSIEGSYYTVMGLPTHRVSAILRDTFGFQTEYS